MSVLKRFIGTGFGSGYSPVAPGTIGSLAALIPIYFSSNIHPIFGPLALVIIFSILSLWTTTACVEKWGKDPGIMVIDEFAGQSLTFIGVSISLSVDELWIIITGFILFRFFDILKPLGINRLQKLENGWGILADDLLAGFYALICLKTLIFLIFEFSVS